MVGRTARWGRGERRESLGWVNVRVGIGFSVDTHTRLFSMPSVDLLVHGCRIGVCLGWESQEYENSWILCRPSSCVRHLCFRYVCAWNVKK